MISLKQELEFKHGMSAERSLKAMYELQGREDGTRIQRGI